MKTLIRILVSLGTGFAATGVLAYKEAKNYAWYIERGITSTGFEPLTIWQFLYMTTIIALIVFAILCFLFGIGSKKVNTDETERE